MRIIKILFKSLLTLIILGVLSGLIAREILLFIGAKQVTNSLSNLRNAYYKKTYLSRCGASNSDFMDDNSSIVVQLRFLSSTEYVTEILCSQFSIDSIELDRYQLPLFVKKVPGSSGIIWGKSKSGIALEIFGRKKTIGVEDEMIVDFSPDTPLGIDPSSSCAGYGFTCCQPESTQGIGEKLVRAIDCPESCFSSCTSRPLVLAFNTQPVMNQKKRDVVVNSGDTVTFSYVINKGEAETMSVMLEYGDGDTERFISDNAVVEHTYLCTHSSCRYNVRLVAEDNHNILSAELPISTVTIIVRGGQ